MAKLLIIEDEDFIRELYKRQFEKTGFLVEGFGNGTDGLKAALANKYDALLLDIMLPDINGLEILRQIKQNETAKSLPVILLTNLGQDEVIKEGFKIGAAGYLIKASFTPEQVVTEVNNILSHQPSTSVSAGTNPTSTPPSTN